MRKGKKKELRSVPFMVMLTPSEKELIEKIAEEKGISMSTAIKHYYIK
jgi:predicted transcriptional regulator